MDLNKKLFFYNEATLMYVNKNGFLRELKVPFQVKAITNIGKIQKNTIVYVEAVTQHHHFKIMYRVLNQWVKYDLFIINNLN
jgi:enterochelin esterase-like enzyme